MTFVVVANLDDLEVGDTMLVDELREPICLIRLDDDEGARERRLLLTEIGKRLEGHPLRPGRIARPLHVVDLTLTEEGLHVCVQRAEVLAHASQVELLAPLLDDLVDRHAHAAPLVAEQGEQAHRAPRRCGGVYRKAATLIGAKIIDKPQINTTRGQTTARG